MRLPVIVSMGGVNAAGRTSGFQSFRRMIIETLPTEERQSTIAGLAVMMGLVETETGDTYRCEDGTELDQAGVADRFEAAGKFVQKSPIVTFQVWFRPEL